MGSAKLLRGAGLLDSSLEEVQQIIEGAHARDDEEVSGTRSSLRGRRSSRREGGRETGGMSELQRRREQLAKDKKVLALKLER